MRGNLEFASGWCATCAAQRKIERPSSIWGAGDLLMILLTCGLWIIPKMTMRPPFVCHECGARVMPGAQRPT